MISMPPPRARSTVPHRSPILFAIAISVFWALGSVFVLHPFTPDFPQPGLDPSWTAVTGEAAAARARWGVDIVFTYGPASPFVTTYFNADYFSRTLPLLLAFGLVHAILAAALLTTQAEPGRRSGWLGVLAIAGYALMLAAAKQNPDAFFLSTVFLVFLLDLQRHDGDRIAQGAVAFGVAATGIFCLSKLSYGLAALPLYGLADARAMLRRRWPYRLPLMGVMFVLTDLAYGQSLADLPAFLRMQFEIIAGYTDAMSLGGNPIETGLFLVVATGMLAVTGFVELRAARTWIERPLLPVGLALFLLLVFKAGFVRHDEHSLISWLALAMAGVALAFARLMPVSPRLGAGVALVAVLAAAVVGPAVKLIGDEDPQQTFPSIYRGWMANGPREEIAAMHEALRRPGPFAAALVQRKEDAWTNVRALSPMRKFDGPVDIIQSDQTSIIANRLDYHPRPVFQEYSTYTPQLMRANMAFYEGEHPPAWVLFAPGSIDDRFPAFAEGPLWPDFIRLYEPVSQLDDAVALHRRSMPLGEIMGTSATITGAFGASIPLDPQGPVFARIVVERTRFGQLLALAYRSPLLTMVLRFGDGQEKPYRFIPAMGAAGFVLSPVIASPDDFDRLAFGRPDTRKRSIVTGVQILGNAMARLAYSSKVTVELTPISVPDTPPSAEAQALFDTVAGRNAWRDYIGQIGLDNQLDGDRLAFQPPNRIALPVKGARRFGFSFGIKHSAWMAPAQTRGVCFDLKVRDGAPSLWHRCLDPLRIEADRGPQSAEVDLPPDLDAVVIEAACRENCDWTWSYLENAKAGD